MDDNIQRDLYHRLGGIEAKVDDIRSIRDTADKAHDTANEALILAKHTSSEVSEMQSEQTANRRWIIGTIITSVFSIIGVIFAVLSAI